MMWRLQTSCRSPIMAVDPARTVRATWADRKVALLPDLEISGLNSAFSLDSLALPV